MRHGVMRTNERTVERQHTASHRLTGKRRKGTYRECEEREKGKLNMGTQEVHDDRICETTLAPTYGDKMKSNIGFFLESGRTIFLHKKPLWGKLKFGIDLGADVNYIKFEDYEDPESDYGDYFEGEALISGMHQCDVGALIGALASVNPVGDMRVSAYFRFIPSYSMLVLDGDVNGSYVSFFTYGGEISWKAIGIGIEGRFGNGKYSSIMAGSEDMEDIKEKYTTSSLRAYITFKF